MVVEVRVEVHLARGLRVHVEAPDRVVVSGANAREAIDDLIRLHPLLGKFVLDDARRLRRHVNIFINDEQLCDRDQLSDPVSDGDRIHILPAVSGGASEDNEGLRSEHD